MKFEKINEKKLKIELTPADLRDRNIKPNELVFASDKTRNLLNDIMEEAMEACHFDVGNSPLLIEAMPSPNFSINIFITKMGDDSSNDDDEDFEDEEDENEENLLNGLDLFSKAVSDLQNRNRNQLNRTGYSMQEDLLKAKKPKPVTSVIYSFTKLDDVINVSSLLSPIYNGKSKLYKYNDKYYLAIENKSEEKTEDIKSISSEFGNLENNSQLGIPFLSEHAQVIVKSNAIRKLGTM